jgi:hypothetical protein
MTWTIYNNDRAWGFLSADERRAFGDYDGNIQAFDFAAHSWRDNYQGAIARGSVLRAAKEPTPTTDPEQTAQHDAATAIGAVGVIGYVMPGDLSRVQAAIKEAQGLINAHMRNMGGE